MSNANINPPKTYAYKIYCTTKSNIQNANDVGCFKYIVWVGQTQNISCIWWFCIVKVGLVGQE